jgi:transposase
MSSQKKIIEKSFKMNAVKYKEDHPELTYSEIAKNLGVSISSIHRWVKEYSSTIQEGCDETNIFRGSGNYSSDEVKELAKLKKENKDLKDALEILKKAMNILNSQ